MSCCRIVLGGAFVGIWSPHGLWLVVWLVSAGWEAARQLLASYLVRGCRVPGLPALLRGAGFEYIGGEAEFEHLFQSLFDLDKLARIYGSFCFCKVHLA